MPTTLVMLTIRPQRRLIIPRAACLVIRKAPFRFVSSTVLQSSSLIRDNLLFRINEDDWSTVLDTNLKGAFLMTKHAARGMIKRRWGRIVNITSVVGISGNKGQANYTASKAGL